MITMISSKKLGGCNNMRHPVYVLREMKFWIYRPEFCFNLCIDTALHVIDFSSISYIQSYICITNLIWFIHVSTVMYLYDIFLFYLFYSCFIIKRFYHLWTLNLGMIKRWLLCLQHNDDVFFTPFQKVETFLLVSIMVESYI